MSANKTRKERLLEAQNLGAQLRLLILDLQDSINVDEDHDLHAIVDLMNDLYNKWSSKVRHKLYITND